MELLPKEIADTIPKLYEQEELGNQAIIHVKIFTPDAEWAWYITEYDPSEKVCFGLVDGQEKELGYFSLEDLEEFRGPWGLPVECDLSFQKQTIEEILIGAEYV